MIDAADRSGYHPILRCFERIDKSNSGQFKAVLQVLGDQMTYADPFVLPLITSHPRTPADYSLPHRVPPKERRPQCLVPVAPLCHASIVVRTSSTFIPALRIATLLLNSASICSSRMLDPVRIPRTRRSHALCFCEGSRKGGIDEDVGIQS